MTITNRCFEYLSRPGRIGPVELRNRMVMAPCGTRFGGANGAVSDRAIDYYAERAKGGASLIVVENTLVVPAAKWGAAIACTPEIWDHNLVPGWKLLTDAIHFWGAKAAVQINWMSIGIKSDLFPGVHPTGPSPVEVPVGSYLRQVDKGVSASVLARELSVEEIVWLEDQYQLAAMCAREAGFDIVMLHCASGYGIAGFTSRYLNKRTDLYGGSFENRMRFGLNITRKVRSVLTPDMALTVRMPIDEFAPLGADKSECIRIAQAYEAAGVDAIHFSCGAVGYVYRIVQSSYYPRAYLESYLEDMRKAIKVPIGVAGSLNNPEDAERVLRDYGIDFADLARPLFADPEYPRKVLEGRPEDIRKCLRCNDCMRYGVERNVGIECALNIEMGKEQRLKITPAEKAKKVVVVGGGPAGMEAARVAAMRGHQVTLFESRDRLGGSLVSASVPAFKIEIRWLLDWFARELNKLGVRVCLRRQVTADEVARLKPDVVIVATGASPIVPKDMRGAGNALTAVDVLSGRAKAGRTVVVAGGGLVGCETALHLAQSGSKVTILEMLPEIAWDMFLINNRKALLEKLGEFGVVWEVNKRITEIGDTVKTVDTSTGDTVVYPADTVIVALGLEPVNDLAGGLTGRVTEVYTIGDCVKARKIKDAVYEGSIVARRI